MAIVVGLLSCLLILFVLYIIFIQCQLRNINRQLAKRFTEHTRQPIRLELFNKDLNELGMNINKCFKAEETLRLNSVREEKRIKELIANISHDLRTPLTAIRGYQQLVEKGTLSEEQMQRLKIAQKHTDELGNLIEHFFEYSYLINADPQPNIEKINLSNLITECLAESVGSFEQHNLTVHIKEAPTVFVLADREMTMRIIQNLIRNCIAYSDGDIRVQIYSKDNSGFSFTNPVKNETELDTKRLFDRFYTADKARKHSTGLGLSIVRLLAERMGGCVSAELNENMLKISIILPLCI